MIKTLRTLEMGNLLNVIEGVYKSYRVYIIHEDKKWNDFSP